MKTVPGGTEMKTWRLAWPILGALLAATTPLRAQQTQPVSRVDASEGSGRMGVATDDGDQALQCEGEGLIQVVPDECMHDGGGSAAGDALEVYCHLGITRFCLSGEDCPWREEPAGKATGDPRSELRTLKEEQTCSRAGLETEWMASAWCRAWSDFDSFSCTAEGKIKLERRR